MLGYIFFHKDQIYFRKRASPYCSIPEHIERVRPIRFRSCDYQLSHAYNAFFKEIFEVVFFFRMNNMRAKGSA